MEFRNWLEQNTVGKHNDYATGAYASSVVTGSEMPDTMNMFGRPTHLTSQDLVVQDVPHKEVTGKIEILDLKRNPCFIQLSDGTKLFIPYDALQKRVQGTPQRGKTMRVVFQRNPIDKSMQHSQIAWATIS